MKRQVLVTLAAVVLLGSPVAAELCTIDAVPAATLLLPYFEVDLDDPEGVDTVFTINNASAAPTIAHVVMWGDWSLPTINFDVFLTGYDVQTVSLRNVFQGNLPQYSHAWNDPSDTYSPHGLNPAWDSDPDNPANPRFMGCDIYLPHGPNPVIPPDFVDRIVNGHTGQPDDTFGDQCVGENQTGTLNPGELGIARGYITIDNVTDCNVNFPNQPGYFGSGLTNETNQLWGDYFISSWADEFAFGDPLVHIEAGQGAAVPTFFPGDYTFYGRYVSGLATDQREPLASTFAARYLAGGLFDGGTDLIVWRDSKCQTAASAFSCDTNPDPAVHGAPAGAPPWYPLNETQIVAFDEEESAMQLCIPIQVIPPISPPPDPTADPTCFPLETQRVPVGEGILDPPYDFGWMYLNLNFTLGDTSGSATPCSTDGLYGAVAQSWVTTNMKGFDSNLTVGYAAHQLTSACTSANPIITGNL